MFDMTTVQRQHSEILEFAQEILGYDSIEKVSDNAYNLSLLLGRLAGKLSIHLSGEDKYIYPSLMSKEDRTIQETSKRFAAEMGSLAQEFTSYKSEYLSALKIKNAPLDFIRESKKIMQAIVERIYKEEKYLYPLL